MRWSQKCLRGRRAVFLGQIISILLVRLFQFHWADYLSFIGQIVSMSLVRLSQLHFTTFFIDPLIIIEKQKFPDVFRGYRDMLVVWNSSKLLENLQTLLEIFHSFTGLDCLGSPLSWNFNEKRFYKAFLWETSGRLTFARDILNLETTLRILRVC